MSVTINASTSAGLIQTADTSGTVEIQSNGTTRLTVASGGVTANTLTTTGNTSISNLTATGTFGGGVITSGTAVASTSGTSIDFTSIPSWVKRITVVYSGVSTNGTSSLLIQIGTSSGIETTGYLSTGLTTSSGGSASVNSTSGFAIFQDNASYTTQGIATIINISGNNWVFAQTGRLTTINATYSGGDKTLSGTLTRVRITTVNGTDTFDAGTINILYEG